MDSEKEYIDSEENEDSLMHYGMPKRSGRYPWGSGDDPYQHSGDFLSRVEDLKKQGLSEVEIAKAVNMTTTQLRAYKSIAKEERWSTLSKTAQELRDKGYSLNDIAKQMGYNNDSSVRSLLNQNTKANMETPKKFAEILKKKVDEKGMIDVGESVERELNISKETLKQALTILEAEGYPTYGGGVPQVTNPGKQTNLQILCPKGTEHKDIFPAMKEGKINSLEDYISRDGGETLEPAFVYPASLSSKRLKVRYADEAGSDGVTGIQKDGVIEIRKGVPDLSLGTSNYAQVRIMVDGTHYLKGMAVYSDDMPDGVDVVFNTNKTSATPDMGPKNNTILKPIKNDPDNPFGSAIKEHGGQSYYDDPNGTHVDPITGKKQSLSLINKRAEEGDWSDWADKVPAQFLSKQTLNLAKRQINQAMEEKMAEFNSIMELTNPTVKKRLLQSFSDDCDSAAVHLYAAALPRQKYHVILPVNAMGDNEIYAPRYNDGEKVALVRYPHGGTFEIPILTVNNKQPVARKLLGTTPIDAVGINSKIAERLSGADFDGDTVMVIPTGGKVNIKSTPPLKGLEGFDPKREYPYKEGIKLLGEKQKQNEMGRISNLITDMTLIGATQEELARAVRHSMVVIDAEKHHLDYKRSELENDIASLKNRYQGHIDPETGTYKEGAATLISRAKSKVLVDKRQGSPKIDPETGKLIYKTADDLYYQQRYDSDGNGHKKGDLKYNKDGTPKMIKRTQDSTKMMETDDAYSLVSDANTAMERLYADYANHMKSLANQARKEILAAGRIEYSASAKAVYDNEVKTLNSKLNIALKNSPRERMAQLIANSVVNAKLQSNPDMTSEEKKKAGAKALIKARVAVGSKRQPIEITDREWEAIQAGAISENKLSQILNNTDLDKIRQRATPRATSSLNTSQISRIQAMKANGRTTAEIAKALGVSTSTITKYASGKEN